MRTGAFSLLVLCSSWMAGPAVAACVPNDFTVAGEFERSEAVVRAKVVAIHVETSDEDVPFHTGNLYVVRVDEQFKGDAWGLVAIYDENDSGRFELAPGGNYVLFLDRSPKGFEADGCGNSAEVDERAPILAELRQLKAASAMAAPPQPGLATKGIELHSWQESHGGAWRFALLPGTNRSKSIDEIRAPATRIDDVEELKARLATLAAGEYVTWILRYENSSSPQPLIDDVARFARARSLHLTVVP
jgi:hypothetical protein